MAGAVKEQNKNSFNKLICVLYGFTRKFFSIQRKKFS